MPSLVRQGTCYLLVLGTDYNRVAGYSVGLKRVALATAADLDRIKADTC